VRTSWLFGKAGPNFVKNMLKLALANRTIKVVNDQIGCPTYTADLAKAILDLINTKAYGIYHITNQGAVSWYEFAKTIFTLSGTKIELLPIDSSNYPTPAKRPKNSLLDPFPLEETIGYLLPLWSDALQRYLVSEKMG